jgi:hypothetical protein
VLHLWKIEERAKSPMPVTKHMHRYISMRRFSKPQTPPEFNLPGLILFSLPEASVL